MRDGHPLTLLSSSFLVFHTNDFSPARAAQSDNQLDVSQAAFEPDAAAIVIV
jgi:hypothetical protein